MAGDVVAQRPLFGGAITSTLPLRFEDVSKIREVPDNQEVLVDPSRDESLIFELLEMKLEVPDDKSAAWFLQDLANEQDAELCSVIQQSPVTDAPTLTYRNTPAVVTTAVGQMAISKGRQGREARNIVRVYLANIRLRAVTTDVLVVAHEPLLINPLSESAAVVGAGYAISAAQQGIMPMEDIFKLAISNLTVNDWSLFGN